MLLVAVLLALGAAPARGESQASYSVGERETLVKELGLTPEQARDFQAIGDKYDKSREAMAGSVAAKESDLEKALAAPQPDDVQKSRNWWPRLSRGTTSSFSPSKISARQRWPC